MEPSCFPWKFSSFLYLLFFISYSCSHSLPPEIAKSAMEHRNYTAVSSFRVLNRRSLVSCPGGNQSLRLDVVSRSSTLSDEETVKVIVSGVRDPSKGDWVAMISPSGSRNSVQSCPLNADQYIQTGDLSNLPLLCHYPVKAQFLSNDPGYLACKNKGRRFAVANCSGTLTFDVINIRTDIEFAFFGGGFETPCIFIRSKPLKFGNPNKPLYAHLSSVDSSAASVTSSSSSPSTSFDRFLR